MPVSVPVGPTTSLQLCVVLFFQTYLVDTLPAPFADEIRGISKASGVELGTDAISVCRLTFMAVM